MKFDQLIECITTNIFVEKSYTISAGKIISRPVSKTPKLSMSLDRQYNILNSLFVLHANLRAVEI